MYKTLFFFFLFPFCCQAQTTILVAGNDTAGFCCDGGPAISAELNGPGCMAFDDAGNLYFYDYNNNRIRTISPSGIINTYAGYNWAGNTDSGVATSCLIGNVNHIAADHNGNIYFREENWIKKISPSGFLSNFAGDISGSGPSGDGGPATLATFILPAGIAVDDTGNVYIVDEGANSIRKVSPNGIISTLIPSSAGLISPTEIVLDAANNIYVNTLGPLPSGGIIYKISTTGTIDTFAGGGYSSSSGIPATAANLYGGNQMAIDGSGNLFIVQRSRRFVKYISPAGIISTYDSLGLNEPDGLAVDASGYLYISNSDNNTIVKVKPYLDVPQICQVKTNFFPNPVIDELTVTASGDINNIEIINMVGQRVFTGNYASSHVVVNMMDLPTGVYFVRINETEVKKIIKE